MAKFLVRILNEVLSFFENFCGFFVCDVAFINVSLCKYLVALISIISWMLGMEYSEINSLRSFTSYFAFNDKK